MLHWLAHTERKHPESPIIGALNFDLFRWLGSFSLSLYMGHFVVAWGLYLLPKLWGVDRFWTKDFHMLSCYLVCFAYSQTVQRVLDRRFVPKEDDALEEAVELVSLP